MGKKFKFRIKLQEHKPTSEVALFYWPYDVEESFGTRARVQLKGTINGFPFRGSMCNMGKGHMMVVNKEMRAGARCGPNSMVEMVVERDEEKRVVAVPAYLKKIINADKKAAAFWKTISYTHQKEYVREIEEAKRPETKQARIAKMMEALKKGERKK
jgi:hypothetical protein